MGTLLIYTFLLTSRNKGTRSLCLGKAGNLPTDDDKLERKEGKGKTMLEKRLQRKILDTIDEMALIQAYSYRETDLDRLDDTRNDFFEHLNILRLLLSLQIPDRKERNIVVDYIREGIFNREWRKFVEEVETGD